MAEKKRKEKEEKLANDQQNENINTSIDPYNIQEQKTSSWTDQESNQPKSQIDENVNKIMGDIQNDQKGNFKQDVDHRQFQQYISNPNPNNQHDNVPNNQFINKLDRNTEYINDPNQFHNNQNTYDQKRNQNVNGDQNYSQNSGFNNMNDPMGGNIGNNPMRPNANLMKDPNQMKNQLNYKKNMESGSVFRTVEEVSDQFKGDQKLTDEQCRNFKIGPYAEQDHSKNSNHSINMNNNPSRPNQNPPKDLYSHNLDRDEFGNEYGTGQSNDNNLQGIQGQEVDPYKDDLEKAIKESQNGLDDDLELQRAIQASMMYNNVPNTNNNTNTAQPNFDFMTEEEQMAQLIEISKNDR